MGCKRLRCQHSRRVGLRENESGEKNALYFGDRTWLWNPHAFQTLLGCLLQLLHDESAFDSKLLGSIRRKFIAHNRAWDSAYVRQQEVEGLDLCFRCARRCQRLCTFDEII